ncbi:hypothetical protein AO398_25495 [Methylobacterium sp. GXS13]|nr:hypothetical protein AO398_25495 [Methylobacterium sp. GXS13]
MPQGFIQIRRCDSVKEARSFHDGPVPHDDHGAAFEQAREAWRASSCLSSEPVQEQQDGAGHKSASERSTPGQRAT